MDSENQEGAAREQQASPQAPKTELPKIGMPKIQMEGLPINNWILKLKEYWRVLKIAKKPDMSEFKTTAKAAALGIAILGVVGFIIAMIAQLLTT